MKSYVLEADVSAVQLPSSAAVLLVTVITLPFGVEGLVLVFLDNQRSIPTHFFLITSSKEGQAKIRNQSTKHRTP